MGGSHVHDRLRPQVLTRPILVARLGKTICLTRANGWGSAGQCPALASAKTPAVRIRVSRVAAAGRMPATLYARKAVQLREGVA